MKRGASWLRRCPGVTDVAWVGAWLTLCPWVRPHPDRWDLGPEPGPAPRRQRGWSQLCLLLGSDKDRTGCRGRAWGLCHHFRLVSTAAVFLRASRGETGGRRSSAFCFSTARLLCTRMMPSPRVGGGAIVSRWEWPAESPPGSAAPRLQLSAICLGSQPVNG